MAASDRVRSAWQRRHETDYEFNFWTTLGWNILTCGIYGLYVLYQLMRRDREHNLRRIELLDAGDDVRLGTHRCGRARRGTAARVRTHRRAHEDSADDSAASSATRGSGRCIAFFARGLADVVAFIFIDGDLVRHDYAEGAIEAELSAIFGRLGAPIAPPDPSRLKHQHNYAGRVVASIATCGLYVLWWTYDVMVEGNAHFQHNWRWEDDLARSVQSLLPTAV